MSSTGSTRAPGRAWLLGAACVLAGCVRGAPPPPSLPVVRLDAASADEVLRPGDFLFRYVDERDPVDAVITGAVIQAGAVMIESTSEAVRLTERAASELLREDEEAFARAVVGGDPNAVHMAIYLGGGATAEAFGTTPDAARVARWELFAENRRNAAWRVLRHRDARVGARVAEIAGRWATGRMGYEPPFEVFVRDAAWGEHGRAMALVFAEAWQTEGGPSSVGSMFCSQFAVAVLQSALSREHLGGIAELRAEDLDGLPSEGRIDAVASPLRVYGEWVASGAFEIVAHLLVE